MPHNFYQTILELLKEGFYPKQISSKLNISKQRLNYYISALKRLGYINKISQGAWEVIKSDQIPEVKRVKKIRNNTISNLTPFKNSRIRGHAFVFTLKLPTIPNWEKRADFIEGTKLKHNILRIFIKDHKVWLCNKTIVIYSPQTSYLAKTAEESENEAVFSIIDDIIPSIENLLKTSLKIRKNYVLKVSQRHFGRVRDALAKWCDKNKEKIRIKLENGWFLIDNSFQLNEAETMGEGAVAYMDKHYTPFIESLMRNPFKVDDFLTFKQEAMEIISSEAKVMQGIQQNQLIFDKNMQSHIQAVRDLGSGVRALTKAVRKEQQIKKDRLYTNQKRLSEFGGG